MHLRTGTHGCALLLLNHPKAFRVHDGREQPLLELLLARIVAQQQNVEARVRSRQPDRQKFGGGGGGGGGGGMSVGVRGVVNERQGKLDSPLQITSPSEWRIQPHARVRDKRIEHCAQNTCVVAKEEAVVEWMRTCVCMRTGSAWCAHHVHSQ